MRKALLVVALCAALFAVAQCGLLQRGTASPAEGEALAQLEAKAEEMTQGLGADNVAAVTANYTATMRRALPDEKLREVWQDFQNKAGAFQSIDGTRHEFFRGFNIIFVDIQFASEPATLQYTFDGDGLVSGLYIRPYGFSVL